MAVFPLKILTPDGVAFDGSVSAVSCRTINGQIQLLAKHIDYCTALGMGEAHITLEDGTIRRAACMGGMLSMIGGECRLLATTFEWADAIDKERAERSKARAEAILAQKNVDTRELELAEARLKRALVRSSVAARRTRRPGGAARARPAQAGGAAAVRRIAVCWSGSNPR